MKLNLPRLLHVQLHAFSLYQGQPDASFDCSQGVTCLVGANGVGKSTLLSAITYALTGIVPDPSRTFKSFDEYYARCLPYANRYFKGRIAESDREEAAVGLVFECNGRFYKITRKLFDPGELDELEICSSLSDIGTALDSPITTRRDKQSRYESELCLDSGFSSFSHFACFHHFVCTFDEKRNLLLYSDKLVEQVLNTVFLFEPALAVEIDNLRRNEEKFDSRVRNIQWEITKNLKRINETAERAQSMKDWQIQLADLEDDYATVRIAFDEKSNAYLTARGQLDDLSLELAQLAAREASIRDDFSSQMTSISQALPDIRQQPSVRKMVDHGSCCLCGVSTTALKEKTVSLLNQNQCPVCESKLERDGSVNEAQLERLKTLDVSLSKVRKEMKDKADALLREQLELKSLEIEHEEARNHLAQFEVDSLSALAALRGSINSTSQPIKSSDVEDHLLIQTLQKEKSAAEKDRSAVRARLSELRKTLRTQFTELEDQFVPLFRELADTFLGVDIGIRLDESNTDSIRLIVSVRGTNRRQEFSLSESQKFFLDIAFRMALLQLISSEQAPSTLILDTPEGSLDIAYEKRAGTMLAKFVDKNNRVLMSANLNSSQLLLALARECGEQKMSLVHMMEWADLTLVQRQEAELFEEAKNQIIFAMTGRI